jgi:hypothetical protein
MQPTFPDEARGRRAPATIEEQQMARDKRGEIQEPDVDEVMNELIADDTDAMVAGPTARNEAGDTKRAVAKATGQMSASKVFDPDMDVDPDGNRPKSGSKAGLHSFQEVPPEQGVTDYRVTRDNAEIVDAANIAARKAPAERGAPDDGIETGFDGEARDDRRVMEGRERMPAPGNRVSVPKGQLVRGEPSASQSGGRSQSSTGQEKPPKRSARAGGAQSERPLSKGGTEERD